MVQEILEENKNGLATFQFEDITTFKVTVINADPDPEPVNDTDNEPVKTVQAVDNKNNTKEKRKNDSVNGADNGAESRVTEKVTENITERNDSVNDSANDSVKTVQVIDNKNNTKGKRKNGADRNGAESDTKNGIENGTENGIENGTEKAIQIIENQEHIGNKDNGDTENEPVNDTDNGIENGADNGTESDREKLLQIIDIHSNTSKINIKNDREIRVTDRNGADNGAEIDSANGADKLTERETKIVILIQKNNTITRSVIAERLDVGTTTVYRDIESLKKRGIIERIGGDNGGYWKIKK
jgi:uncharacterized membrane protein